ncbi:GerMN domain-containing protein [Clostridium sp.]|uniref:GerMN domain-containing protein n=1 Tax=Clostridium sp. TaxID=1506 RepID=UPI002FCB7C3D
MKKRFFVVAILVLCIFITFGCKNKLTTDNSNANNPNDTQTEKPSNENPEEAKPGADKPSTKDTNCRLYFFNTTNLKHYYIDTTIPVEESAIITALTKELQNQTYNKDFLTLTNKVQVKSAKIDKDNKLLTVVFSDSYVDHMTLGSSTESGLLTMLLTTYGYNLGVDKVAIYFGDELYTSLKGDLPEGYFKVDYPEAEKYSK